MTKARLQRVDQLAKLTGRSSMQLALGFHYAQPFQVIPIIGPYNKSELLNSLASCNYVMTAEELDFILDGKDFWA